tara:strand:- start:3128 stop:6841 length:3714 start_codon:yes stop_codon:yes gene_type:complete
MLYTKNPKTGRTIKIGSATYNKLMNTGDYLLTLNNGNVEILPAQPVYPTAPTKQFEISPLDNLMINRYFQDLGTTLYYAKFEVVNPKRYHIEYTIISRFAEINPRERGEILALYDLQLHPWYKFGKISKTWNWNTYFEHMHSAADIECRVLEFYRSDRPTPSKRIAGDIRLSAHGINQPTIGGTAGMYLQGGDICKPEHYRENSCMINLFLHTYFDDVKTFRSELTHEALYEMATGNKYEDVAIHSISLNEAKVWADKWKFRIMAIDRDGRLIFEHTPTTVSKKLSSSVWRLMVHDNHVWGCTTNVRSFTNVYRTKTASNEMPIYDHDISASLSDMWRRAQEPEKTPPTFITDMSEIFDVSHDVKNVITNINMEELFIELWNNDTEPGNIRLVYGAVDAFSIRIPRGDNTQLIRVSSAVNREAADDQLIQPAISARAQVVFDEAIYKARQQFHSRAAMSRYSKSVCDAFQEFKRGPRVGKISYDDNDTDILDMLDTMLTDSDELVEGKKDQECTEFDVSRAYTGFLSEITTVPVFSVCDDLIEVTADQPVKILPTSFYLIRPHTQPNTIEQQILFSSHVDFVTGETLLFADSNDIKYTILAYAHPSVHTQVDGKKIIQEIYDNIELPDSERKTIANIIYGLSNKLYNRSEVANCYLDKTEALENGGRMRCVGPGYISVKNGEKTLTEGYKPIGAMVLDKMRIMLYKMCKALGKSAIGVRTDAVYCTNPNGKKLLENAGFQFLADENGFDKILKIRSKTLAVPELPRLRYDVAGLSTSPESPEACIRMPLKNELATKNGDWSEVDKILNTEHCNVAIEATVPGAGKTYTILRWLERNNHKDSSLIVCPWNSLASVMQLEGFTSITLHKLLGRGVDEGNTNKPYNLDGITHIHFEEAYLHDIRSVGWMYKFMQSHRQIKFTMTGDPGQIAPPNQTLCVDSDQWYEDAFAKMFKVRMVLKISKRINDMLDRQHMQSLCDDLREEKSSVQDIMMKYSDDMILPRFVNFADLTAEDAKFPHIAATNATVALVNAWAHRAVFNRETSICGYNIGEHLLGGQTKSVSTGKINRNSSYYVVAVDNKFVTVESPDHTQSKVRLNKAEKILLRPYCRTAHSTQGISMGNKIFIHDIDSFMVDHRWMRTAVSRCGTFNIVIVMKSNSLIISNKKCVRIAKGAGYSDQHAYIQSDPWDKITPEWLKDTIISNGYKCRCGAVYNSEWRVGKYDQSKPFNTKNSMIVCESC